MTRWDEVRQIDWSTLGGAYDTAPDVAGALETLRAATSTDDDDFGQAWSDVLSGHVMHQGTIYPVTAAVLPFVIELLEASPALEHDRSMRAEVAIFPAMAAEAARRGEAAVGTAVLAAIAASAARLSAWTKESTLRDEGLAALLATPSLADGALASHPEEHVLRAVLRHAPLVVPSARAWAAARLRAGTHAVLDRGATLLAQDRVNPTDAERLAALAEVLTTSGQLPASDRSAALDALSERFGIRVERRYDQPGEIRGTVSIAESDWFVVRAGRNVTVRWPSHPFSEGDEVVLVDLDAQSRPREVRGTGPKAAVTARFEGGERVRPPR